MGKKLSTRCPWKTNKLSYLNWIVQQKVFLKRCQKLVIFCNISIFSFESRVFIKCETISFYLEEIMDIDIKKEERYYIQKEYTGRIIPEREFVEMSSTIGRMY